MTSSDSKLVNERSTGLGGTDAAAIMGLNPWKSAVDVYLEKTETAPKQAVTRTRISELKLNVGNKLEPLVIDLFEERTQLEVIRDNGIIRHPILPYLLAHVDGLINLESGEKYVFEAKTAGMNAILSRSWGNEREGYKAEPEDVPASYYYQLQWYLMITNREAGYLAVLLGGNEDFRIYFFERDYELGIKMKKALKNFWVNHVKKRIPPAPSTVKDASNIYQRHTDQFKQCTSSMLGLIMKAKSIRAEMKKQFAIKEALDAKITDFIGNNEGIIDEQGHTKASWKESKSGKRLLRLF